MNAPKTNISVLNRVDYYWQSAGTPFIGAALRPKCGGHCQRRCYENTHGEPARLPVFRRYGEWRECELAPVNSVRERN